MLTRLGRKCSHCGGGGRFCRNLGNAGKCRMVGKRRALLWRRDIGTKERWVVGRRPSATAGLDGNTIPFLLPQKDMKFGHGFESS